MGCTRATRPPSGRARRSASTRNKAASSMYAGGASPSRADRAAWREGSPAVARRSFVRNGGLPITTSNASSGRSAANASATPTRASGPRSRLHSATALASESTPTTLRALPRRRAAATRKLPVPHAGSRTRIEPGSSPASSRGWSDQSRRCSTRKGGVSKAPSRRRSSALSPDRGAGCELARRAAGVATAPRGRRRAGGRPGRTS